MWKEHLAYRIDYILQSPKYHMIIVLIGLDA